jgi:transmembrane sensor
MSADEAEKIAADWLARQDRGLTAEASDRMELWLEQSSFNRVAYLRLKSAWQRADRLAALKSPLAMRREERPSRWRLSLAVAAALTLLAGGGAWLVWHPSAPSGQSSPPRGRTESLRLADGPRSSSTPTQAARRRQRSQPHGDAESGEAYFDVVHDDKRPFTVYAGNRRITDIGTKFSVFRKDDDVRVTVREGRFGWRF